MSTPVRLLRVELCSQVMDGAFFPAKAESLIFADGSAVRQIHSEMSGSESVEWNVKESM